MGPEISGLLFDEGAAPSRMSSVAQQRPESDASPGLPAIS